MALLLVLFVGAACALKGPAFPRAAAPAETLSPTAPTATNYYNDIAFPLDVRDDWSNRGYAFDSQGLAEYIGTSYVALVLRWDASRQAWDWWDPSAQEGDVGGAYVTTPFSLDVGGGYWIEEKDGTNAPTVFSIVGDVPNQGTVTYNLVGTDPSCSYNQLMLPLDQSGINNAQDLAESISSNTADVEMILEWNASRQAWDWWDPSANEGEVEGVYITDVNDFPVSVGYPYWACLHSSVNGNTWPTP